jgi:hypothetical protein
VIRNCAGNVLFIILIAVALFAALTYSVSHSGRNQNPMNRESTKLAAGEILSFANSVKTAVDRLRMNGCQENQLDFGNTVWTRVNGTTYNIPVGHNSLAPVDGTCNIFHAEGLSQPILSFPDMAVHPDILPSAAYMPGSGNIIYGAIQDVGINDRPELLLTINILTEDTCKALNRILIDKTEFIPSANVTDIAVFNGTFPSSSPIAFGDGATPTLARKREFCYRQTPSPWLSEGVYYFVKVLLER